MAPGPLRERTLLGMSVSWRARLGDTGLQAFRAFFSSHGCTALRVLWSDIHGTPRGKQVSTEHFEDELAAGISFSSAALVMDLRGEVVTGTETGWPNVIAVPRAETLCLTPNQSRTAQALADLFDRDGTPLPQAPRSVLTSVLDRAARHGFHLRAGIELEFYLLSDDGSPLLSPGKRVYRLLGSQAEHAFFAELNRALDECGLPYEAHMAEDGPGQFEIVLPSGDVLKQADHAFLTKCLVKELATLQGLTATFLAKPVQSESGCGLHCHLSVDRSEGSRSPRPCSESTLRHFVGGMVRYLPEAIALYMPTVNSYRRMMTRGEHPMSANWGRDNRTTAVRTILSADQGTHVENRVPAGEANPYLVLAASIATGLQGILEETDPPPPVEGNAFSQRESGADLSTTLAEAVERLDSSRVLRDWLGDPAIDLFIALKRDEVLRFRRHVTDWERDEYLPYL